MRKIIIIAFAGFIGLLVLLFIWSLLIPYSWHANPIPLFLREADITIWRAADCTSNCTQSLDSQVIAKYPELQNGLQQIDQKFNDKFSKGCDVTDNNCLNQFRNETIAFSMRADIAAQMSSDLERAGAGMNMVCFEGGCHGLEFNRGNATYNVGFYFAFDAPIGQ